MHKRLDLMVSDGLLSHAQKICVSHVIVEGCALQVYLSVVDINQAPRAVPSNLS